MEVKILGFFRNCILWNWAPFWAGKTNLCRSLLGLCIALTTISHGQEEKPKVALVLSGGGARGIAHIPLLQALDSLNIVPDMIIGTSMGSIVGGLYAMGHSGDSIAKLVKTSKWDDLLGGKNHLQNVTVEEKSEYDKYLIGLGLTNGKIRPTAYLLNDQNLRNNLANMTWPANSITKFDSLPIPFRAVTTDIINSELKVLDSGSLSFAMRASMSIPGIFEPVLHEKTLLVDGGVLNNFPTDIAKKMGADIIIGSDVSGSGYTIEKLDNISSIVTQTMMMANFKLYPSNKELCDVFVNHFPNITYSTADFRYSSEIYENGKIATLESIAELAELAEKFQHFEQRPHNPISAKNQILLDSVLYRGISTSNHKLVEDRVYITPGIAHSQMDMANSIKRTMGTNLFRKIDYDFIIEDNQEKLLITGYEKPKHQVNASLHYDNYRGFGIIGNYSGRNIIGSASRFILTLDVAEQPKFLAQVQKNFGTRKNWWAKAEVIGRQLKQKIFIGGEAADNFREKSLEFTNQINRNLNSFNSYVGVGFNARVIGLKPRVSTDLNSNVIDLQEYSSSYIGLDAHFYKNTMDRVFYAEQGTIFRASINRSLKHSVNASFVDATDLNADGPTSGFTKFQVNFQKRFPLKKDITGILETFIGFLFEDNMKDDQNSVFDLGYSELYSLGGNLANQRTSSFAFLGLQEEQVFASQFAIMKLGLQFKPIDNCFITPQVNIGSAGFGDFNDYTKNVLSPNDSILSGDSTALLLSVGTVISYDSILGPVDFAIAWENSTSKVDFFINVGIPFDR